jgi:peptidoglycan-N-acetylglucosamine deacetylase
MSTHRHVPRFTRSGDRPASRARWVIVLALLLALMPALEMSATAQPPTSNPLEAQPALSLFALPGIPPESLLSRTDPGFTAGTIVEVIDPGLYLRSAPGFASTVLAKMALYTRGTVLAGPTWADGHPWYEIRTSAYGTGWASGYYLRAVSTPSMTPTTTPPPASGGTLPAGSTIEVIDPDLYLRSAPGFGSTVLARMALGTRGTVLAGPTWADGHPWYQIRTSAYGTGWASGRYLRLVSGGAVTPTPSATLVPGTFSAGSIVEVIDPDLYLRSAPGFSSIVLARMALYTRGTVLAGPTWADGHSWYRIRTAAYGTGWASGRYLRIVSGSGSLLTKPTDGLSRIVTAGVSGRKEIALTFDAGSDRGYAKQILDVLKANEIEASFGITGVWAQSNPDLIERMVNEGHQIINHTWSHPSFTGYSASPALTDPTARKAQLTRTADYIYTLTGYRAAPFWRPPYGDYSTSVQRDTFDAGYYLTIMWTCDSMSWNGATVTQILNRCAYPAQAGNIVLMHVGTDSANDYFALQRMIDIMRGKGLSFVTIEDLLR